MNGMRLQAVLPNESTEDDADAIIELAVLAESLGYDAVWLPDHILPPAPFGTTYGGVYEPLVLLAAIAARTSRIRVGTSVLILPLREPILLAKQVATIDRISGGRVTLGVGVGWDADEYVNLGAEFSRRGRRADAAIRLLRDLWAADPTTAGRFETPSGAAATGSFAPRPVAGGGLPIMVGGNSNAALRRAATSADEWQAVMLEPAQFGHYRDRLVELAAESGRLVSPGARSAWEGDRTLPEVVAEVDGWRAVGAEHLAVWFGPMNGFADRMARFATAAGLDGHR